jgi:phosphate transport system substrate-binding protein
MGRIETWGEIVGGSAAPDEIHVYTRSDACGAAATWADYLGGYRQEDLEGIGVYGDPGLAAVVSGDPLAIGYNNLNFAYDADTGRPVAGVHVVAIDLDGNDRVDVSEGFYATKTGLAAAIADGRYPVPPARDLYLVTLGAPDGVVKVFVEWVLTDGQALVEEAGYIRLGQEQIAAQLIKLRGDGQ